MSSLTDTLSFAQKIAENIKSSHYLSLESVENGIIVCGYLPLAHDDVLTDVAADCCFKIPRDWRLCMPKVFCKSPWLKYKLGGIADWHVYSDRSLCWEYELRWIEKIAEVENQEGTDKVIPYGAQWCLHSSQWLLYRHYYATLMGIEKWPKEWSFWAHGADADRQYRQDKIKSRSQRSKVQVY